MLARVERMRRSQRALELLDDLIVVFLVGAFSGIGLSFAVRANQTIVPQVLRAATSGALGLLTGLAARHALRRRTGVLRAAAAVAAQGIGLYLLGWFSAEQAGLALPGALRLTPDWPGLLQIALGAAAAVLILRARTNSARSPRRSAAAGVRPVARSLQNLRARLPRPAGLRKLFVRRGRSVRLVGTQQHRCPYCLEPVLSGDPRGMVKCRVCRTPHHADCWAVTGVCQVPHYHR